MSDPASKVKVTLVNNSGHEIPVSGILFSEPTQLKLDPKDVPREFVNAGGYINMRFDIRCDSK